MNLQPTYHNEFHFAEGSDSCGCCCFWMSKSNDRGEEHYIIDSKNRFKPVRSSKQRDRIRSNERLTAIIKEKLSSTPYPCERAFYELKQRVNDPMSSGEPITSEKLQRIVEAIYELKANSQNIDLGGE